MQAHKNSRSFNFDYQGPKIEIFINTANKQFGQNQIYLKVKFF